MDTSFMSADQIAEALGISKSFAYKITQTLNQELRAKGFHTIAGRVSSAYFQEKYCYQRKD